jgi:hypothetical protein
MSDVSLQDTSSSLQKEPVRIMINKAFGLFSKFRMKIDRNFINFHLIFDKKFNADN